MAPFPFNSLAPQLQAYKNAEIVWCQEEQKNAGAWSFIEPRIRAQLKQLGNKHQEVNYVGRPISASTAAGYGKNHKTELDNFLREAMA